MNKKPRYSPQTSIWQALSLSTPHQGFALPIALMLGIVTVGIGIAMVLRSQSDQMTAGSQQRALSSEWIADAGLANALALLKNPDYQALLTHNYDPLSPITRRTYLGANGIPNDGDEEFLPVNEWQSLPRTNANPCQPPIPPETLTTTVTLNGGQYRLLAYRYRDPDRIPNSGDEVGQILLEGQRQLAQGRRWISVAVFTRSQPEQILFPGIWAEQIDWGKGQLQAQPGQSGRNANILCTHCQFPSTPETGQNEIQVNSLCDAGTPTQSALRSAISADATADILGEIQLQPQSVLLPQAPLPSQPCWAGSGENCYIPLPPIQQSLTLPTPEDLAIANTWPSGQPIRYRTSEIDLHQGSALTLNATVRHPIYLYVTGQVSLEGRDTSIRNVGTATQFHLYGNPIDPQDLRPDQSFAIANSAFVENALIVAPDALLKLSGSTHTPSLLGAFWVKTWNSAQSEPAQIQVPDAFSEDPTILKFLGSLSQFTTLGPIRIWQQQPQEDRPPQSHPAGITQPPESEAPEAEAGLN